MSRSHRRNPPPQHRKSYRLGMMRLAPPERSLVLSFTGVLRGCEVNPEESHIDVSEDGISRRRMLKRIGAGAAIAWSAPVLTSLKAPAFAATPTPACTQCAGDFCLGQTICGAEPPFGCGCGQLVGSEPNCFCYHDDLCFNRLRCRAQSDCPTGQTCVHTCCDSGLGQRCWDPCAAPLSRIPGRRVAKTGRTGMGR
jgi:hypothetical protein